MLLSLGLYLYRGTSTLFFSKCVLKKEIIIHLKQNMEMDISCANLQLFVSPFVFCSTEES